MLLVAVLVAMLVPGASASASTFAQQATLTASDEIGYASLGQSVALSADGGTALIGGRRDNNGVGAVWVFTRSGSTWTQQAKLAGGEEIGVGGFGASVALSADGNTALIGGPGDNNHVGAAWVFTRSGSTWTQQGSKLTGREEIGHQGEFGASVALSSDATTALIGAPDNEGVGAAWVFTRSGSTWAQQGSKLTGAGEIRQGEFGESVALSSDGETALIGAPNDGEWPETRRGAAWVFTRSGSTWTQQGEKLTGDKESGGFQFGFSVALSGDGNTALIGGPKNSNFPYCCRGSGAAWVFTRLGSTWAQQGERLTASTEGQFGSSVALSGDGNTALIGARGDEGERPSCSCYLGSAWVFARSGSTWAQQGLKLTGGGEVGGGQFGTSVALSSDATTALIGGPEDNEGVGAAWAFTRSGVTWTQQGEKLTGEREIGNIGLGSAVALSSDGKTALIGGPKDNHGVGAAWVFTRSGSTWTERAKLTGGREVGRGQFGTSVALSSDGKTALIGGPRNNGIGAAWVFTRSGSTWRQRGPKLTGAGEVDCSPESACGFCPRYEEGFGPCILGQVSFGDSVALSSNGHIALVGGPGDNGNRGAAWAFARKGSKWTQRGPKLTGGGEANFNEHWPFALIGGRFGTSVALSADGKTALIGGPRDSSYISESLFPLGAAWVFTRSGSTWAQQGEKFTINPGNYNVADFGASVALSAAGDSALIGGPQYQSREFDGAAFSFGRSTPTWTQQGAPLEDAEPPPPSFFDIGSRVALSSDADTAIIGSQGEGRAYSNPPDASWVFTRSGLKWTQQGGSLTCGTTSEVPCGVSLSGDGTTALAGTAVYVRAPPHK